MWISHGKVSGRLRSQPELPFFCGQQENLNNRKFEKKEYYFSKLVLYLQKKLVDSWSLLISLFYGQRVVDYGFKLIWGTMGGVKV